MGSQPRGISASRGASVLGQKGRYAKWRASHLEQERARTRAYYHANKEQRKADWEAYYAANRDRLLLRSRARREANPEQIAQYNHEYYHRNIEAQRLRATEYRRANLGKVKDFNARYYVRRRNTDPSFKIVTNLRNRINGLLRKAQAQKSGRTITLIGCTAADLKTHLEAQFLPGMTWENHGKWHIDHIKPCASFDLTDPEQQRTCFHYTNLQPLWAADNIRKGARIG